MKLGENIREKRKELKMSQEYIAEQLGVSRQAVSKWETKQAQGAQSDTTNKDEIAVESDFT